MNAFVNFTRGPAAKPDRRPIPWAAMRYMVLIVVTCVSTGCADDVVMKNPQTGQTETCHESLRGLDPWSQSMACVADHEAQGWTRAGQQ